MSMLGIRGVAPIIPPAPVGEAEKSTGEAFQSDFTDAISRVEHGAQQSTNRFLRGEEEELHQVVLAGERADVAFEMFLGVRNKVVSAYQEIMRMQL
jgi:flagellar hook-basal body complex protein FliE